MLILVASCDTAVEERTILAVIGCMTGARTVTSNLRRSSRHVYFAKNDIISCNKTAIAGQARLKALTAFRKEKKTYTQITNTA